MLKNRYHLYWAVIFLVITIVGFYERLWYPLFWASVAFYPGLTLHVVFSMGFIILYLIQVLLVSSKDIKMHGALGFVSTGFGMGNMVTGVFISFILFETSLNEGRASSYPSLLLNLSDAIMFGWILALAIKYRTQAAKHKLLMTLSLIVLVNAGLFRVGLLFAPGFTAVNLAIVFTIIMVFLYLFLYKRKNHLLPKPVIAIGAIIIVVNVIRIPIGLTPQWAWLVDSFY